MRYQPHRINELIYEKYLKQSLEHFKYNLTRATIILHFPLAQASSTFMSPRKKTALLFYIPGKSEDTVPKVPYVWKDKID